MTEVASLNKIQNAAVTCQHCAAEIGLVKPNALPKMISLQCSTCRRRKIYKPEDVHPLKPIDQNKNLGRAVPAVRA